jgi:hypothetical protein
MKKRLITLLTMGHALDRARDRKGAYTLRYVNKIPKFGPAARAAAGTPPAEHSGAVAQSSLFGGAEVPAAAVAAVAAEDKVHAADGKNGKNEANENGRADAKRREQAAPKMVGRRWSSAFAKRFSFLTAAFAVVPKAAARVWGRLHPRGADSGPRAQAELALEHVKVVRNDLSDADLVVVAAQPKPEEHHTAATPAVAQAAGHGGNPWKRVTARWAEQKNRSPFAPAESVGRTAERKQTPCSNA